MCHKTFLIMCHNSHSSIMCHKSFLSCVTSYFLPCVTTVIPPSCVTSHSSVMCHKSLLNYVSQVILQRVSQVVPQHHYKVIPQLVSTHVAGQLLPQHTSLPVIPHPCLPASHSLAASFLSHCHHRSLPTYVLSKVFPQGCINASSVMCHLKSILSMCHCKLFLSHVSIQTIPHPLPELSIVFGRNMVKLSITTLVNFFTTQRTLWDDKKLLPLRRISHWWTASTPSFVDAPHTGVRHVRKKIYCRNANATGDTVTTYL